MGGGDWRREGVPAVMDHGLCLWALDADVP